MSTNNTVRTVRGFVRGIDAKTGKERVFESTVTLCGQNVLARACKAIKANIKNQRPWMLLGAIQYEEVKK
jgi:hypothetical protein